MRGRREKMYTKDELLPPRVAAPMLGISRKTLWVWTKKGKIKAVRTPTGRFLYPLSEVKKVLNAMYGFPVSPYDRL